jgi:TRAP-type C4-dicarboxylate transport system permease small subunit
MRILQWLYQGCGILAAISLMMIMGLILAQVIGRLFGIVVPSADEFAGYCMAASTFLALAYTFRSGGHIRVTMVIQNVPKPVAHLFEIICLLVGALLVGFFAWYTIQMVWDSFKYGDLTQGYRPIPLWIPQIPLAIGLIVLFVALMEELWHVVRGRSPVYETAEDSAKE